MNGSSRIASAKFLPRYSIIQDGVTIKYPDQLEIGKEISINQHCFIAALGGVTIGDYVRIGAGSKIVSSAHVFDEKDIPIYKQGISSQSISIGSNCLLGFDVKILPGVIVGDGCIIATNAVLTGGKFPKNSIIVGMPAVVQRER